MKGLIIKDILNLRNYMKQLILVFIFFVAYGIFLKNGVFVGSMITLMLSMQVITTMSYDEYAKWDKYALTMNVNRKDIVLSKYVFFIMSIIIGIVVGIISSSLINIISDSNIGIDEILVTSIMVPCVFAILFCIIIPIVFKVGVEKARVVMMAIFFTPTILGFIIFKMAEKANMPIPDETTLELIFKFGLIGLIVLTVVFIFISYKISLSIYNKKEF